MVGKDAEIVPNLRGLDNGSRGHCRSKRLADHGIHRTGKPHISLRLQCQQSICKSYKANSRIRQTSEHRNELKSGKHTVPRLFSHQNLRKGPELSSFALGLAQLWHASCISPAFDADRWSRRRKNLSAL